MEELAPSSAEITVVAVLTLAGVLAALGLLFALRRRFAGRDGAAGPSRPTWGLIMLTLIGTVLLFIGGRTDYVIGHPGSDTATLFTLHGLETPVYWIAYLILGGLLITLIGALLKSPITLRWVAGPPALLVAALLIGLLTALKLKIDRFDRHLAERHLPAAKPTDGIYSDTVVGADARFGWVLGVLGAALLTLTVVLVVAGPSEVLVLVTVTAGLTLLSASAPIGGEYWALRDGTVEWVTVPALRLGGTMLLWPIVMAGLAALLLAIPFLPRWYRGIAAFAAALAPGWILLVVWASIATVEGDAGLNLLRADGYTLAVSHGAAAIYLLLFTPFFVVPWVAIRAWRITRRGVPA
ncbi:hypothetical protein ACFO1B_00340 [Dactylosporangium siamense]|uniref:Uncharacterized protein n=1 Tax=Dactylosporangium siamense TaxID=685454 RepID=A0A919PH92_9ACTN|nr:hypothetical protein [Dactylosporangium siamense]GIG42203.1 hypothetical protein Dsi01nite_002440 [Dactylosporangium siamense]